jgi:hypothetical protein
MKYNLLFILLLLCPLYVCAQGIVTKPIVKGTSKSLVKGKIEKSAAKGVARHSVAIGFKKSAKSNFRREAKINSIKKLNGTRNSMFSNNIQYRTRVPNLNQHKSKTNKWLIRSVFHNGFDKYDYSGLIEKSALIFKKSPQTIKSNIADEFLYCGKYRNKTYSKDMLETDFVNTMNILSIRANELFNNMSALKKFDVAFIRGKQRSILFDEKSFAHVFGRYNNDFKDKNINQVFDLIIETLEKPQKIEINAINNYWEYTGSKYKVVLNNQNRFVTMFRIS